MSVQRTTGGIRYDTKVKSSARSSKPIPTPTKKSSGSGSDKLAAYREKTGTTTPGQTPSQYNAAAEAAKKQQTGTDVSPMARAGVPPQPTPQPLEQKVTLSPAQSTLMQQRFNELSYSPVQSQMNKVIATRPEYVYNPAIGANQPTIGTRARQLAYDVKQKEDKAMAQGFEAGKDFQLSWPTQLIYQKSQTASEKLQTRGQELKDTGYYAGGYGLTSVGNIVEMGGMIPGGIETMARRPEVIKPAIVAGAAGLPRGIATQAKTDPIQLLSDVAVTAGMFKGAGDVATGLKARTPYVTTKSAPSEFLIKGKVADSAPITTPGPKPVTQAEFMSKAFGKDVFKVSDVQSQAATIPNPSKTIDVFTGKSSKGYTDVYIKADKATAEAMRKQYTGTVEQIRTQKGSYTVFEPTGQIVTPPTGTGGFKKVPTPDHLKIGDMPTTKPGVSSPFRVEKRVPLQEGKITLQPIPERFALPEYTQMYDAAFSTIRTGSQQIPRHGTLKTRPTREQTAYADIMEYGIKPGQEKIMTSAYEPVFARMGTSLEATGVNVKIVPRSKMVDADGKTIFSKDKKPIIEIADDLTPIEMKGVFAHEAAHVLGKGGMPTFAEGARGKLSEIRAEAVAESGRIKAEKLYNEIYGKDIKTYSQIGFTDIPRNIIHHGKDVMRVSEMVVGYPLGKIVPFRMQREYNILEGDAYTKLSREQLIKAKRKAAQAQTMEYKPRKTDEELIAEFEKQQAEFLKTEDAIFQKAKKTIAFKEPAKATMPDLGFMHKMYNEATARGTTAATSPRYAAQLSKARAHINKHSHVSMFAGALQYQKPQHPITKTESIVIPTSTHITEPYQTPIQEPIQTQYPYTTTQSTSEPNIDVKVPEPRPPTTRVIPRIPEMPIVPEFKIPGKKGRKKKTLLTSKRTYYDVTAPIADWADFFGGLKK